MNAGVFPARVRRLAVVVPPADGEALGSWVDRVAADFGTSTGNAARWLGLECRLGPGGSTMRPRFYGVGLTAASIAGLTAATGLAAERFEEMCLARFAGTALDLTGLDLSDDSSLRPLPHREWALFLGSRACPACLAESGGVWPLWWRLGVAAACPRHGLLLLDSCPACGMPLRRGHLRRSDVSRRRGADPLQCGNAGPQHPSRCQQRLDVLESPPATAEVLTVQHVVLEMAFGGPGAIAGGPVTGREWFQSLRFAAALHRLFAPVDYVTGYQGMPPQAAGAFMAAAAHRDEKGALRIRNPPSAAHAAADLLLAVPVLAAADPGACTELLLPLAAAEARLLTGASDRRDRMWTVDCAGILPRLWKAIRRSRHRVFDADVRPVLRTTTAAGLEYRHIPQLIDVADYGELVASCLPGVAEVAGRRLTAAACGRLLGARSWDLATDRLGMASHAGVVSRNAGVVRGLADPEAFWTAISEVMDRLAARGPVDYAARRDALAGLTEIPAAVLDGIAVRSGMRICPGQYRHAAAWVWAQVTGGDIRDAPAYPARLADGRQTRGAARRLDGAHRRRFVAALPPAACEELLRYGARLLAGRGVPS
ncbi:TniQ family protein [Frankia tisae]|uniref:TniQ family protein n=1 Tax=Frankia tisae TaxID=2950104 RepID=UPI0021C22DC5|nr:TniQ family protein [Frankia tisae]